MTKSSMMLTHGVLSSGPAGPCKELRRKRLKGHVALSRKSQKSVMGDEARVVFVQVDNETALKERQDIGEAEVSR